MSTLRVDNIKSRTGTVVTIPDAQTLAVTGVSSISGNQTVGGTQTVSGDQLVSGVGTVSGSQSVLGSQTVTGWQTVSGSQIVSGNTNISGIGTIGGTLYVTGDLNVSGGGNIVATTGVGTFGSLNVTGTTTYDSIVGDLVRTTIGSGTTIHADGIDAGRVGVITAATFSGNATGLTGSPNITVGNITAADITASGTVQYEDVVSVDSAGIGTFKGGLDVVGAAVTIHNAGLHVTGVTTMSGLTYPSSDGTANQVLKTDGSGALTFATAAGGLLQYANAYKVNTYSFNYSSGRILIPGMSVTLPNTVASTSSIFLTGHMTTGHDSGDPSISPRWEYSTDNASWSVAQLATYAVAGSHAGLDANSNWGTSSGYESWGNNWNVVHNSFSTIISASDVSQARYYRVTVRQCDSTDNTVYINRHGQGTDGFASNGTTSLVVMELKAN